MDIWLQSCLEAARIQKVILQNELKCKCSKAHQDMIKAKIAEFDRVLKKFEEV